MENVDLILGLFFSDENNLVFDNIKFSESMSDDAREKLKMLSFKFLGPVFLTAASEEGKSWKIQFIESSLSLLQERTREVDIIQSFFNLNSSVESEHGITNLFALIGTPYTEDKKIIYKKMVEYIHPSILQGRYANKALLGDEFKFNRFIKEELSRGMNLIEYYLGKSRKIYWEEQQMYYCVGIMERIISNKEKESYLYTFDIDNPLRKMVLKYFPSYYVMAILPDYYENLVNETLTLFDKTSVYSNIRKIELIQQNKKAVYLEENIINKNSKKSYGVILIPVDNNEINNGNNIPFYKKNLRLILDVNKGLKEVMLKINPDFKFKKWATISDENLNEIRAYIDNKN